MRKLTGILILAVVLVIGSSVAYAAEPNPTQDRDKRAIPATKESSKTQKKLSKGQDVVDTALRYKGVPYKFGGNSPKGFDCSGFVQYVYNKNGRNLPRTADKQFQVGKPVAKNQLQPGDILFFTTYEKGASHCGIYMGKGNFIHASSSRGISVAPLTDTYWKPRYLGARRVL